MTDAPIEVQGVSRSVVLDPDLFRAFKSKAAIEGTGVNQALNDLIAASVGLPSKKIRTSPGKPRTRRRKPKALAATA